MDQGAVIAIGIAFASAAGYFVGLWMKEKAREVTEKASAEASEVLKQMMKGQFSDFENRLMEKLDDRYILSRDCNLTGSEFQRRVEGLERRERHRYDKDRGIIGAQG